jgi:hypothetical protein
MTLQLKDANGANTSITPQEIAQFRTDIGLGNLATLVAPAQALTFLSETTTTDQLTSLGAGAFGVGLFQSTLETDVLAALHLSPGAEYLDGRAYGLFPDLGTVLTTQLTTALQAAKAAGKPLLLQPGKYIYDGPIGGAGGGLVCYGGKAWLDAQDAGYNNHVIDWGGTSATPARDILIQNIKFTCSTRPDAGLDNGAPEEAGFLRVTYASNVRVWGCEFMHNYGGCCLFRNVNVSSIIGNVVKDVWKDVFHITDDSKENTVAYNHIDGCGDDGIAVVGYVAKGARPVGVNIIGNVVKGCRLGRAYAIVGGAGVRLNNNVADGKVSADIPQKTTASGIIYTNNCGLYIGTESSYNTYDSTDIRVRDHLVINCGPCVTSAGVAVSSTATIDGITWGINSYNAIHVAAYNRLISDVDIEATLRNVAKGGFFAGGNAGITNISIDLNIYDNTDPNGIIFGSTAGTFKTVAAEFQYAKNITAKINGNTCGAGLLNIINTCTGRLTVRAKGNTILKNVLGDPIHIFPSTILEEHDIEYEAMAATSFSNYTSLLNLQGVSAKRRFRIFGNVSSIPNLYSINGAINRALTVPASQITMLNKSDKMIQLGIYGGTVTSINVGRIYTEARAKFTVVDTTNITVAGDLSGYFTVGRYVIYVGGSTTQNPLDVVLSQITPAYSTISAVSYASGTGLTTITMAAAMPDTTSANEVMAVSGTYTALPGDVNRFVTLAPGMAIRAIYSAAPQINAYLCDQ